MRLNYACLNEFQIRDICGDSQVERTTAPKPKEEFTGMMGNLARALDERHKVMHSSGKLQDTTAQAIRPYNHNNTTTDTGSPNEPVLLLVDVVYIVIVSHVRFVYVCSQW